MAAGTVKALTGDNEVEKEEDVVIEISEPTTLKSETTLKGLRKELAREEQHVLGYQASVSAIKARIVKVQTVVKNVALKQTEE
jgi:hypothetical protein